MLKFTPDSNLIHFGEVICSQLVEVHCLPLYLPKKSYMYIHEISIDTLQDYCKKSTGWPELWMYNEFPARCTVMSKASESCIISEAEGCKVPIEVQTTYKDFMEMYDYTKFIGFAPELLCAVSIGTAVSGDSTFVKHVTSDTVPAS